MTLFRCSGILTGGMLKIFSIESDTIRMTERMTEKGREKCLPTGRRLKH